MANPYDLKRTENSPLVAHLIVLVNEAGMENPYFLNYLERHSCGKITPHPSTNDLFQELDKAPFLRIEPHYKPILIISKFFRGDSTTYSNQGNGAGPLRAVRIPRDRLPQLCASD